MLDFNDETREELNDMREVLQHFAPSCESQSINSFDLLLKATAQLAAEVKTSIQSSYPKLAESLLSQTNPVLLSALPAAAIVEFSAVDNALPKSQIIPTNTEVTARVDGTSQQSIRFKTLKPLVLNPLSITAVNVTQINETIAELSIKLSTTSGIPLAKMQWDAFNLFINAEPIIADRWLYLLTQRLKTIKVNLNATVTSLAPMLSMTDPISRITVGAESATKSLLEIQAASDFPQQHYFIELPQLADFVWPNDCGACELVLTVDTTKLSLHPIKASLFKLHCVAAINCYSITAEPIYVNHSQSACPLVADRIQNKLKILSVDQVSCENLATGQRQQVLAFDEFNQASEQLYYVVDKDVHGSWKISIVNLDLCDHVISSQLSVCNGNLPQQLLTQPPHRMLTEDANLTAMLLTQPCYFRQPPFTLQYYQRALAYSHLHHSLLNDTQQFKACCQTFNWDQDPQLAQYIHSIKSIRCNCNHDYTRGKIQPILHVDMELSDEGFRDLPEAYRVSYVLHCLLRAFTPLTMFLTTQVTLGQQHSWNWHSKTGKQALI